MKEEGALALDIQSAVHELALAKRGTKVTSSSSGFQSDSASPDSGLLRETVGPGAPPEATFCLSCGSR